MSRRGVGNRKRNAADDKAEAERQKRRDDAWRIRVSEGLSTPKIAERLGVSDETIRKDLELAREEHKPADLEELQAFVAGELRAALTGLRDAVASGNPQAVSAQVKALDAFCKLHGLYAPEKRELSGPNGGPIDIKAAQDELLGRIARLAEPGGEKPGDPEPEPV